MITWYDVRIFWRNAKKFITQNYFNVRSHTKEFIRTRAIPRKMARVFIYCVETAITGILVHYAITHFNWISVGLLIAFGTYYIEWFIRLIKQKEM